MLLGYFTGAHRTTEKQVEARYGHVWIMKGGQVTKLRQYIDTLAVAEALRSYEMCMICRAPWRQCRPGDHTSMIDS